MEDSEIGIEESQYTLSKHLNDDRAPLEIKTEYGNMSLSDGDIVAVRELLRCRFENRLAWLKA